MCSIRTAFHRVETTRSKKIPPTPEVVRQQASQTSINYRNLEKIYNDSAIKRNQTNQEIENEQLTEVASEVSSSKGIQPQRSVTATENVQENQTGIRPIRFLNHAKSCPTDIQESKKHIVTIANGDNNNPFLTITTSHIEERFVRKKKTNELYLSLLSTVVLKRKKEKLYSTVEFNKNLTKDTLVDSNACIIISAIAPKEMDKLNNRPRITFSETSTLQTFNWKKTNGHLKKPLATTTLAFDVGENLFTGNLVVLKNMTVPFIGLHFMGYKIVVIYTTHGLIHFPQLKL